MLLKLGNKINEFPDEFREDPANGNAVSDWLNEGTEETGNTLPVTQPRPRPLTLINISIFFKFSPSCV